MKKRVILCLSLCLSVLLAACGSTSLQETSVPAASSTAMSQTEDTAATQEAETIQNTAVLYADFTFGGATVGDNIVRQYDMPYEGELTVEMLAHGLSELTGLDFFINSASVEGDSVTIDWASNSTLIANLDDRVQKEEFHMFDSESMRWFMMDSMWQTLIQNLDVQNVYYTQDGGNELVFEELSPVNVFPKDMPYSGSVYYFAAE